MKNKGIVRWIRNIFIRISMSIDDNVWYATGGDGRLYPPSFYATHTEEEIREITNRDMEELRSLLKKYETEEEDKDKK